MVSPAPPAPPVPAGFVPITPVIAQHLPFAKRAVCSVVAGASSYRTTVGDSAPLNEPVLWLNCGRRSRTAVASAFGVRSLEPPSCAVDGARGCRRRNASTALAEHPRRWTVLSFCVERTSTGVGEGNRRKLNSDDDALRLHRGDPRQRNAARNAAKRDKAVSQQKAYLWQLKAAGEGGKWREIPKLLFEMRARKVPRNVFVYNAAIAALARCRRPVEAEALLTAMLDRDDVAPDKISYNSAINAHARCGDFDAAHRLLGSMRARGPITGLGPDLITYNTVADAAAKCGDPAAAGRVLSMMSEDSISPDIITYNACLAACKGKGDLRRAMLLLELMEEDGIEPDQRSYSALIATAGRRGEFSEVERFMRDMRCAGLRPDKVTFNTAIAAVGGTGQWETAASLLADMKEDGLRPDVTSYTSVLGACGRAGKWQETLRLLQEMKESGVAPNAYSYSVAVDACGKAGEHREALAVLGEMRGAEVRADTVVFNTAIDACSVVGDYAAALRLLGEMKDGRAGAPRPDVVSYGSAITACSRAGRPDEALSLLAELRDNEAKAAVAEARGQGDQEAGLPLPNLITYSATLFGCLKAGQVERGGEVLDEMIAAGIRPNDIHCDTVVAAWSAAGEPERAAALMKRLESHGFHPSLSTYESLVWGFAQVADWEATVRLLAHILNMGLSPSVRSWDAAIAACSQAGHWERALALLADMRRQGIRPSKITYTAAVAGLNRPRYAHWAPKLERLARLLQHRPKKDDKDKASRGSSPHGSSENNCPEGTMGPQPQDYDSSIEALGDAGDADGAACLLGVMRREGFNASPRAYRSVIYACARAGHLAEAAALAKEMDACSSKAAGMPHESHSVSSPAPLSQQDSHTSTWARHSKEMESMTTSEPGRTAEVMSRAAIDAPGGEDYEDEDDASCDLGVVYNCIVCNFAREATGGGNATYRLARESGVQTPHIEEIERDVGSE